MPNDRIIERVGAALKPVPGVAAVVLGGSRARGTATAESDHDFGLYYEPDNEIDVAALRAAITPLLDDPTGHTITPIGEWGPRINGGAWLTVDGRKVDLLYRDLGRVRDVIAECKVGRITMDYQPGHPHGFCSSTYMGEIATCVPLHDPRGLVATLKVEALPFPDALRSAVINKIQMGSAVQRRQRRAGDPAFRANARAGCVYRALCCAAQVLFAVNGRYLINEKAALAEAVTFDSTIAGLDAKVSGIWSALGRRDFARALTGLNTFSEDLNNVVARTGL